MSHESKVCVFYYRLQMKFAKVMFLHMSVILSTRGGVCSVHAGILPRAHTCWEQTTPLPGADKPPGADTPESRHPQEQTPPRAVHTGRCGQQAGGMHPTGMHTCL